MEAKMHLRTLSQLGAKVALVAAAFFVAFAVAFAALPQSAQALETAKCTARPNADTGSDVLGGTQTRITWEGQAGDNEQVKNITLTLPEGTKFGLDNTKLTVLTGPDLMTRENPEVEISADGQNLMVNLAEPAVKGAYFRVEIYDVYFPAEGGSYTLTGTYTNAKDETLAIDTIPAITTVGINAAEQLSNWLGEQGWVQAWNDVKFLHLFLDPTLLVTSFPVVLQGFFMALAIIVCAFPLAIPFGLILAFMRLSESRILRALANLYVNIIRGTPLFLQIYIAFFGLPLAGINIPNFPLGVAVLVMNSAAYQCEIFRSGIQAIPPGQSEAARSLGMTKLQTTFSVIIPQMIRIVIPTMTNEFILLYKDTSMLAAVGVMEIVMYAKSIVASTGSITPYIVAAIFYLIITIPMANLVGVMERKLDMDKKNVETTKKSGGFFSKKAKEACND
ncbi:MAG: amino acid ABC transporter permease [Eggerthellaceae bacterium]